MPTRSTAAGTQDPGAAGPLEPAEINDTADNSTSGPAPDLSGKRVRAIPGGGGTKVIVGKKDFADHGIKQNDVKFDYFVDNFTVKVGDKAGQISKEAADFLTKFDPYSYEYIGD